MRPYHLLYTGLVILSSATSFYAQNARPTIGIEQLLRDDGTIELNRSAGSINLEGWRMTMPESGPPVFSKTLREAASGDEFWEEGFGNPLIEDRVNALVIDGGGNLYAGGRFAEAGGASANHVAMWDGATWTALGSGMNDEVLVLAIDPGGNLYAGGAFTQAGGTAANHVAMWDGANWSALGSGVNDEVLALAIDAGGNLYAGGAFTQAAGISAGRVAKWDGTNWSAIGLGMNNSVRALAVYGANLYAGGDFTLADGYSAMYIAEWDGFAWIEVGSGMDNSVEALAVGGSILYAGGDFVTAGGVSARRIAKWDGTNWSGLGSEMNLGLSALAVDGSGNVYVSERSTTGVQKWDGVEWSQLGPPEPDQWVRAMALDETGTLFAGGEPANHHSEQSVDIMAQWDGTSWSSVGDGILVKAGDGVAGSVWALAVDGGGDLFAGGLFDVWIPSRVTNVAKWDGSSWSALGDGLNNRVFSLAVDGAGNLYAGGEFTTAGGLPANYVASWNGLSWSALGNGMNERVYALAMDGSGNLYAGGKFTFAGGPGMAASYIAKWDGAGWSALGSGFNNTVRALAVYDGILYAAGEFTMAGDLPVNYVARWDGSSWSALGNGMNWRVYALAVDASGSLYAGGQFSEAGETPANLVAKWDGLNWSALGAGLSGVSLPRVDALRVDGSGNLYAGGSFESSDGQPVNNVAMWDGATWNPLGAGTNGDVYALDIGSLWVGGNFTTAGDKASYGIGKWNTGERRITVDVTVLLEGAYIGSGQMSSTLDAVIPTSQPFSGEPWFYAGSESVSEFPADAVDWLLMELRADSTEASTFAKQAVLLLADGSIVDTSGTNPPGFDAISADSVYIVVRHRNHLDVMSPDKIEIQADVASHDFSSSLVAAFSRGAPPLRDLSDGSFGLFAADADGSGFVLPLDFDAYIAQTATGVSGYQSGDFNLDGTVDALDFNLYLANVAAGAESQVP